MEISIDFHVEVKITITSLSLSPMSSNAATEPADTKYYIDNSLWETPS